MSVPKQDDLRQPDLRQPHQYADPALSEGHYATGNQPTPTDREAAVPPATGEAAHKVWFICGAWTIREQGPILNFERPYKRAQYVYRCDKEDGHDGDHVDSVLGANWRGPTPDEAATSAPAPVGDVEQAELPPVDEQCNRELKDRYENAAPKTTVWCLLSCRERQLRAERAAHKATQEQLATAWAARHEWFNATSDANHKRYEVERHNRTLEAENQELRRKVEETLVLIKDWWAHPSAHSNPVGPMLREVLALFTAKEER